MKVAVCALLPPSPLPPIPPAPPRPPHSTWRVCVCVCVIQQQAREPCLQVAPVCLARQRWAGSINEEQPSISVRAACSALDRRRGD